ncbi:MAG TPA: acyl-CoA dehydrogenase [bacterium]|nr:acyl-CoA dehydrogenase [bacterium]
MAFRVDKRDIQFVMKEVLDLDKILSFDSFKDYSIEDFDMVVDQAIRFATEKIAPLNKTSDEIGAKYDPVTQKVSVPPDQIPVYKEYCENGWLAPTGNPEFGGGGFPGIVGIAVGEAFVSACMNFMMTPGLTRSAAHVIEIYGTDEQKATYIEKMISGEWAGTMCLTEPGAGSAVGDLTCSAKPDPDGDENTYLISGTKSFISSGDQDFTDNIIHLVLARVEGAPKGMQGVSLFIVPKFRINPDGSLGEQNDVVCGGIEEKMGIHGSPTCTLNFGEAGKCRGVLIGEINRGIKAMFVMMNEARIGVGLQGLSQMALAYTEALDFARERIQGVDIMDMKNVDAPRVPIIKHPDIRRMIMKMKAYAEAGRALIYKTAYFSDIAEHSADKAEKDKFKGFVELLTPVCKAYITDVACEAAGDGIMVLGGYGYCHEYPLEQYYRDAKIACIYEGTNGIQALDLLGRKVGMKGGMVLMSFLMEINQFIMANKQNPAIGKYVEVLEQCRDKFAGITAVLPKMGKENPYYPVLNAVPFMHIFGEFVSAYLLLEQAKVASEKLDAILADKGADDDDKKKAVIEDSSEAAFYFNKVKTAAFFCANILPGIFAKEYSFKFGDLSPIEAVL